MKNTGLTIAAVVLAALSGVLYWSNRHPASESTTKAPTPQKLLLGDDAPVGNATFAKPENDPRVFTIASYNKTSLDKSANDLRDKRLLTLDFDKLSQVELVTKKQDIQFGRNKQEWQIVKPKPSRADNFQVEEIVRKLRDAKMNTSSP